MKKVLLLFAICLMIGSASAQDFPKMDDSPMDVAYFPPRAAFRSFAKTEEAKQADMPKIRVTYSRPQKKGRDIFGSLQKFGEVWRVGANESTEILFFQDVKVGSSTLKAGRYTVYAIPQEKEWEVHFSTDNDGWGQYAYNPDKSMAAKISVPTEKTPSELEAFSIVFEAIEGGANMIMGWDDTMVRVPIKF